MEIIEAIAQNELKIHFCWSAAVLRSQRHQHPVEVMKNGRLKEGGREGGETEAGKGEREGRGMVAGRIAKSKSSFLMLPNLFLYVT